MVAAVVCVCVWRGAVEGGYHQRSWIAQSVPHGQACAVQWPAEALAEGTAEPFLRQVGRKVSATADRAVTQGPTQSQLAVTTMVAGLPQFPQEALMCS